MPLGVLLLAAVTGAREPSLLVRHLAGVEVNWAEGTLTAQAGAAADIRMPNPNAARPGAERRAKAAAEAKLGAALRQLGLGKPADAKGGVAAAKVSRTEYQSNGGVVLWLRLRFADLVATKSGGRPLCVKSMPLTLSPVLVGGGKSAPVAYATYRQGVRCPKDAIGVERDARGRLVLPAHEAKEVESLAGAAVVIYLEKPQP